jgi:peptidoglycan/xylan/chitin deacetylase (PgdA/CDA1 family)
MAYPAYSPLGDFRWPEGKSAALSLSFDDARLSQADRGLSILDAYDVKATFYVIKRGVDARLEQWREAVANGHEIGNHTLTHPCSGNFRFARSNALEEYTLDRMEQELADASSTIEQLLGVRPVTFAYPCGQTFVGRGLHLKSYIPLVASRFLIGRGAFNEVPNDPAYCDLAHVTGMDLDGKSFEDTRALLKMTINEGRWLILFGHEVGEQGPQTVLRTTLDFLCRFANDPSNRLWVDTVANIGRYVQRIRST